MNMNFNKKAFVFGLILATIHFILFFTMALYFGLGMDSEGVWLLKHVYLQPGFFLGEPLIEISSKEISGTVIYATNFIFYSIIGYLLSLVFILIKRNLTI
jgi:hypothetical protein